MNAESLHSRSLQPLGTRKGHCKELRLREDGRSGLSSSTLYLEGPKTRLLRNKALKSDPLGTTSPAADARTPA